jgi:hypothetical protein
MRHRWLINISLLAVALILSIFVFFTPEDEEKKETPPLTTVDSEKVHRIRIERQEEPKILEFEKDGNGIWQIKSPLVLPANRFKIESLLRILSSQQYKKLTELPALDEVKLNPPQVRVQFDDFTIDFGDVSPIETTQRYIKMGESLYLIMDTVFHFLKDDAPSFVNLSILGENPKITELRLPEYHLLQKEGKWVLESAPPENREVNPDSLNHLIDQWEHVQALSVKAYTVDNTVNNPQIEIKFGENGQNVLQLAVVSTSPNLMLARLDKGVQYQLPAAHSEKLLHLPLKKSDNAQNGTIPETSETIGEGEIGIDEPDLGDAILQDSINSEEPQE